MKSIVLVRLAYSNYIYNVYGRLPKHREIRPPLGLMYIASYLEKFANTVHIIDAEPEMLNNDAVLKSILEHNPDYVGITATTPEFPKAKLLCDAIKNTRPDIKTVMGGPHYNCLEDIGYNPDDFQSIDHVVCGDGEEAFLNIINGKETGKIVAGENIAHLDSYPLPARHLIDYNHYKAPVSKLGVVKTDLILTARGCQFNCSFCSVNRKVRYRNIEDVVNEIEFVRGRYGVEFFMFLDDTLTSSKTRVANLCNMMIKNKLNKNIRYAAWVRADTVDYETLKIMKQAGITDVSMGVESGNQEMLDKMNKGTKLEQYEKAYNWMSDLGFQTRGSFILGFPYETHKSVADTINFAKKLKIVRVSCNIMTPYPGTKLWKMAMAGDGICFVSKDFKDFTRYGNSVIETPELSKADLENYQKKFLMEFYLQLKVLFFHIKQVFKGNISLYYYRPVLYAVKSKLTGLLKRLFTIQL